MNLPERICRHQHPLEWNSPAPRSNACQDCIDLAVAVSPLNQLQNQVMYVERPAQPQVIAVVCPRCGGAGGSSMVRRRA